MKELIFTLILAVVACLLLVVLIYINHLEKYKKSAYAKLVRLSEEYFQKIKESYADSLTFSYPVSDTQALSVSVLPVYPESEAGAFFQVSCFQIITTEDMELDNSLPVLFGN